MTPYQELVLKMLHFCCCLLYRFVSETLGYSQLLHIGFMGIVSSYDNMMRKYRNDSKTT